MTIAPEETAELRRKVAKLTEINRALMQRVENSLDLQGNAYHLFQAAILLDRMVRERTVELERALEEVASTNRELNEAAIAYVNDRRGLRIEGDRLDVSSIYRWYRDDFGPTDRDVINHLMAYAEPDLAMRLQHFDTISEDAFDWRLNDATP